MSPVAHGEELGDDDRVALGAGSVQQVLGAVEPGRDRADRGGGRNKSGSKQKYNREQDESRRSTKVKETTVTGGQDNIKRMKNRNSRGIPCLWRSEARGHPVGQPVLEARAGLGEVVLDHLVQPVDHLRQTGEGKTCFRVRL